MLPKIAANMATSSLTPIRDANGLNVSKYQNLRSFRNSEVQNDKMRASAAPVDKHKFSMSSPYDNNTALIKKGGARSSLKKLVNLAATSATADGGSRSF